MTQHSSHPDAVVAAAKAAVAALVGVHQDTSQVAHPAVDVQEGDHLLHLMTAKPVAADASAAAEGAVAGSAAGAGVERPVAARAASYQLQASHPVAGEVAG